MLIICNGMPRSGSTLQYNLVRGVVEKMDIGTGEGFFTPKQSQEMTNTFLQWANDNKFHVIKTQAIPSDISRLLDTNKTKICYTYRDLRDVAASFERRFKCKGKELFETLDNIINEYYTVQQLNNLISIKYEDMAGNIEETARNMAESLYLSPSQEIINAVAQEFSLKNARKKIQRFELRYKIEDTLDHILKKLRISQLVKILSKKIGIKYTAPYFDPKTLMHADHIAPENSTRENYLSQEQIEYITLTYRDWLAECGYL